MLNVEKGLQTLCKPFGFEAVDTAKVTYVVCQTGAVQRERERNREREREREREMERV